MEITIKNADGSEIVLTEITEIKFIYSEHDHKFIYSFRNNSFVRNFFADDVMFTVKTNHK